MNTQIIIPEGYIVKDSYLIELEEIQTFALDKITPNGSLIPLVNTAKENTPPVELVYITYCAAGHQKGPHVHLRDKIDRFICIEGQCIVGTRNEQTKEMLFYYLDARCPSLLYIPPYNSHAIYSDEGAAILSICNEPYIEGQYNQVNVDWEQ